MNKQVILKEKVIDYIFATGQKIFVRPVFDAEGAFIDPRGVKFCHFMSMKMMTNNSLGEDVE
jgi:hypothetical protein